MALQSTGTGADIIAHGGSVNNSQGQRGSIRIKTGGYMQFHNGSRWLTDGSQVVWGDGNFNFNAGGGVTKLLSSRTGSANLADGQSRTTTFEVDSRTLNGWLGNDVSARLGEGKIFAAANVNNKLGQLKSAYNVGSITKSGVGIVTYNITEALPSNKVGLAYQSDLSSAEFPYGTPSTTQVTVRGTLNSGASGDATDSGMHLSIIKFR